MRSTATRLACLAALVTTVCLTSNALAAKDDLGDGFMHHGVATPVSNHRGTVATTDGQGNNIVLVWLFDHRGGYALLWIDAETGKSKEYPMPFSPGGDCPYASVLSSGNKFYTHFNSHFCEFDPAKKAFTFCHKTAPQMAMSMTESADGVIWSATYPNCGLVSFDPKTREFKDYGHVHKENWRQYPRFIATDDTGYVYFGIGSTSGHILGLDPATGKVKPMMPESLRKHGYGRVWSATDGKVYGLLGDARFVFYKGEATRLDAEPKFTPRPIIASSQALFHRDFPDGKKLVRCDTVERVLIVEDPKTGKRKRMTFDYSSEGAHVMGLAAAPNGTICGGTAFPMRFFSYDPKADKWINRAAYGQWNTVARQGDRFFVGGYGHGFLLEWDPSSEWVPTVKNKAGCNPLFLAEAHPDINRPHDLLAHPDGKTVVLAGTPGYGMTGGGLLFWDRQTRKHVIVKHTEILPQHATRCLAALPNGKLLGGSTTAAGTGGEKKAKQAELYIMDLAGKKLDWHAPIIPGVQHYSDLCNAPDGLVYGVADWLTFFVFDPAARKLVYKKDMSDTLGRTCTQQGPRIFVKDDKGAIYMLFARGVARVAPKTFEVRLIARSPVTIGPGGTFHDGRIYFASGSHVYSWQVK